MPPSSATSSTSSPETLTALLARVRACRACADLPCGPRPVVRASETARVAVVGQAPGRKVHASGVPWDDASGARLRAWLGVSPEEFYDESRVAIVPMGFCYPGKAPSGDNPPRPECAPLWHAPILERLKKDIRLVLVGRHAAGYYLGETRAANLTQTVRAWKSLPPRFLVLPHPSPRNNVWLKRNPWFEADVLPELRLSFRAALGRKAYAADQGRRPDQAGRQGQDALG